MEAAREVLSVEFWVLSFKILASTYFLTSASSLQLFSPESLISNSELNTQHSEPSPLIPSASSADFVRHRGSLVVAQDFEFHSLFAFKLLEKREHRAWVTNLHAIDLLEDISVL